LLKVKVLLFGNLFYLHRKSLVAQLPDPHRQVGLCEVCGKRAEVGKVNGYAFMCPHCAHMTKAHSTESHDSYSTQAQARKYTRQ
jgi:hypothetical protein